MDVHRGVAVFSLCVNDVRSCAPGGSNREGTRRSPGDKKRQTLRSTHYKRCLALAVLGLPARACNYECSSPYKSRPLTLHLSISLTHTLAHTSLYHVVIVPTNHPNLPQASTHYSSDSVLHQPDRNANTSDQHWTLI